MSLFDRNRPCCPYCECVKLDIEDVIDTASDYEDCEYSEITIGICPRCGKTFQYKQVYTLEPKRYEDFEELEDDEDDY